MNGFAGYNDAAQLDRTVLAWNRSALAAAANGGLLAREGFVRDLLPLTALGAAVVGVGVALWLISTGRYPASLDRRSSHLIAGDGMAALAATLFVIVVSAVDLMLAAT